MTDPYAVMPVTRPKPIPNKCSTCAGVDCKVRGTVIDWTHCEKWTLNKVKQEDKHEDHPCGI